MTTQSEQYIATDLSLPNDTKALLLFKKFLYDPSYRDLICNKFKYQYYSEYPIAAAIHILIKYYKKYNRIPTIEVLKGIIDKTFDNNKRIDTQLVKASVDSALDVCKDADELFIRNNIVNFVSSVNAYNIILENIEKIQSQRDVSAVLKELNEIENLKVDNSDLGMSYFKDLDSHLDALANPEARLSTGYESMDKKLSGGWLKDGKCLAVFMGVSHVGKSLWLSNLAVNSIKQGKFVVIVSLEMSEHVYASRIDAHISKEDINLLHIKTDTVGKKLKKFHDLNPNSELVIKEFAANSINARQLGDYLHKLEAKMNRKIDILYLDYLSLMSPIYGKEKSLYEKGSEVVKDVRALSYEFNMPIVTAVQSNRGGYNTESGKLGMENVSESIAIPQSADVIFSIFQTDDMRTANLINLQVTKNRLGGRIGDNLAFSIDYTNLVISEDIKQKVTGSTNKFTEDIKLALDNDDLDDL